jgi:hypothetical protein
MPGISIVEVFDETIEIEMGFDGVEVMENRWGVGWVAETAALL